MSKQVKILILENDDFLREILGNLLYKKGFFVINGFSIKDGMENTGDQNIHRIIIGSSCEDFRGKQSFHFLRKRFGKPRIFLINRGNRSVSYIPKQDQITISRLSIQKIIDRISE